MRKYWLDSESFQNNHVIISGEIFHHIFDVCRQEVGSHFEVLGRNNEAALVEVVEVQKRHATARILKTRQLQELPYPRLVLAISISRYPVMESVMEKAVELGVARVQPFFSDFSFVRSSNSFPSNKWERWKKIIISATQQSGRGELMQLEQPQPLDQLLENFNRLSSRQGLFAYEGDTTLGIKSFLRKNPPENSTLNEFWIFIGSEGGFSQTEVQQFSKLGLQPVSLGDQILRVETACITTLAVLKYEFGLMGENKNDQ